MTDKTSRRPTAREVTKRMDRAIKKVMQAITGSTDRNDKFSRGLSGEGYDGGYLAALSDVQLVMNGARPCVRPNYWEDDDVK